MRNGTILKQRRGAAMVVCLVLLVFLGTLSGIVIKTVLDDRRETRTELIRQQARLLLRDNLDRVELQRQTNPDFSGEVLELKATKQNIPGLFRLTSVYDEKKKIFDLEISFLDENGKTIFVQKTE